MPIYEYECLNNKHRFEVIQRFNDPPVEHCTICGEPVERLVSSPAIQFKGSGWYITDYARKESSSEKKSTDKAASETKTETAASTEPKTEKPAATTSTSSNKKDS